MVEEVIEKIICYSIDVKNKVQNCVGTEKLEGMKYAYEILA